MDEEKTKYSQVTLDLLDRIELLKKQVKLNNTVGDNFILEGIELFENIVKELNADSIDDKTVEFIEKTVEKKLLEIEEKKQVVNQFIKYGIVCCYTILEGYNKRIKGEKLYTRKKI